MRGATPARSVFSSAVWIFQSTPPVRGATNVDQAWLPVVSISIHAPREGGDSEDTLDQLRRSGFQSTPPVRGATAMDVVDELQPGFQSTPPVRGATTTL